MGALALTTNGRDRDILSFSTPFEKLSQFELLKRSYFYAARISPQIMEIVKPSSKKLEIWHFSLDFWIQFSGSVLFILVFLGFALFKRSLGELAFWIVGSVGWSFALGIFYADQSLMSYCCFNRALGSLKINRRKRVFERHFQNISFAEIRAIDVHSSVIEHQWFTLNPFNARNMAFDWHNSNPIVAFIGFFTGRITIYQVILLTKYGEQIPLTCYETDIFRSKRKLVEQISNLLEGSQRQPPPAPSPAPPESPSQLQQQKRDREIEKWKQVINAEANNAEAHYQLGIALYRNKQRQEAGVSLKRARDLFAAGGNTQKAAQIQEYLWQSGLE
jgi:hypothetical protein